MSISADASRCHGCGFTGADTLVLFPDPPPPLLPVLDAAGLWDQQDLKRIEVAREKIRRRFPQFKFHVCTVMLPPATRLPVFGFWLLNVCPLYIQETPEDRSWTVLLLINARTGAVAVVPGYSAERWLSDEDWTKVLWSMAAGWKGGDSVEAVLRFFETATTFLGHSWKARGLRRGKRNKS